MKINNVFIKPIYFFLYFYFKIFFFHKNVNAKSFIDDIEISEKLEDRI